MHQLSLLVIIVVISGALCEDAVVLMAECPRTKLLNMDQKGKVFLSKEGPVSLTPNITLGGDIITTPDGKIIAITTLYFQSRERYLCFDRHGKLHGELRLTERCYFLENDVRGKYEYRLWKNETLVVQIRRKGGNPPCSEFHKINSKKYHSVPSTIRASARTSFPNDINSSNSGNNLHRNNNKNNNNSLSTIGGSTSNTQSGEHHRHRHRHGNRRKSVERRKLHDSIVKTTTTTTTTTIAPLGHHNGRKQIASGSRRKNQRRGKNDRSHNQNQRLTASGPSAPASHESGRKADRSAESIANKDDSSPVNSQRQRNGKRRSYSNVHDEYSNDEPSAINDRPIQNSLTDFLNPSTKKYHIRNWITNGSRSDGSSSGSASASLSRSRHANADRLQKPTNTYSKTRNDDDVDVDDDSIRKSSISSSSSHNSNLNSSIASSQSPKRYYQNKTAHYKSPAVLKPDKLRRLLRNRPITNNNNN